MTLPELQSAIASAEARKAALPLLDLPALQARVNFLTSQTIFDPARKADLQAAMIQLEQAQLLHEQAKEIDRELARLKDQLVIAEQEQVQALRQLEKQRKQDAVNEFRAAALQMVRAARRCMNMDVATGSFSVGFLETDPNGPFRVSDEMRMGLLRFERAEKEQATL